MTPPRNVKSKKSRKNVDCVCDGSGTYMNPFDQQFLCPGTVHKKSKKSQGKVRRPWAICTDCKKMKDKLAEKDALLREAARLLEDVVMKEGWIRADKLARRIRESLGGGNEGS